MGKQSDKDRQRAAKRRAQKPVKPSKASHKLKGGTWRMRRGVWRFIKD